MLLQNRIRTLFLFARAFLTFIVAYLIRKTITQSSRIRWTKRSHAQAPTIMP
ncbi:hypothetical protein CEV32_3468 [Brucella rhizosphaerae]|uniref:Uncharacterized protein n=1 Tax=Brucella rhizosphaerae TaxID=571254 RepID=A0A256FTL3_9HYPH|nr:hypothetical protein CEV32_3468 [Brucella rhizosphaerae]